MQIQLSAPDLEAALEAVMMVGQPTAKKKKGDEAEDITPGSGIVLSADKESRTLALEAQNDGTYIKYRVQADVVESGDAVIQGKRLLQLVKLFSAGIVITKMASDNKIRLYDAANASYYLQTLTVEGPIAPKKMPTDYTVRSGAMLSIYRRCGRMTKRGDTVVPLSTIQVNFKSNETAVCYASNGYNLCKFEIQQTGNGTDTTLLVLPNVANIIATLGNATEICISTSGQTLQAYNNSFFLSTPKITGEFPDCERVIRSTDNAENSMVLNKDRLVEAVSRAAVVGDDTTNGKGYARITMQSVGETLSIEAVSEVGQANETIIPDERKGIVERIALNANNLMNAIEGCEGDKVIVGFKGSQLPIRVSSVGNELLYVLAPIRTA